MHQPPKWPGWRGLWRCSWARLDGRPVVHETFSDATRPLHLIVVRDQDATRRGFAEDLLESTVDQIGAQRLHRLRNITLHPEYHTVHPGAPVITSGLLSLDDEVRLIVTRDCEGIGLERCLNGPQEREWIAGSESCQRDGARQWVWVTRASNRLCLARTAGETQAHECRAEDQNLCHPGNSVTAFMNHWARLHECLSSSVGLVTLHAGADFG